MHFYATEQKPKINKKKQIQKICIKKNTVVVITEPEQCRQHQQENCPATLISFAV